MKNDPNSKRKKRNLFHENWSNLVGRQTGGRQRVLKQAATVTEGLGERNETANSRVLLGRRCYIARS